VLAISRAGGLNPAARALSVNPSSVYRRLEALEKELGVRLFERLRAGYKLTASGEELADAAMRMEEEILTVERRVLGTDVRLEGKIRIGTSEVLAVHVLADHLVAFRDAYPDVRLDVTLSNHHVDLARRDADIVIRATTRAPEHLVGRSVGTVNIASYAAPAYLDKAGRGRKLADYDWVGYEEQIANLRPAVWMTQNVPDERVRFRFDSICSVSAAVQRGAGCASMPCFVVGDNPAFERLPNTYAQTEAQMWVLTHPDLRRSARVRACLQFFGSRLAADSAKFIGKPDPVW
jgi:DNA-binding transcriptional LysR family regulator